MNREFFETPGRLPLLVQELNLIELDALEEWQCDSLKYMVNKEDTHTFNGLMKIDLIANEWMSKLTLKNWKSIRNKHSLFGVPIPHEWVILWRHIIRNPELRAPESVTKIGSKIGTPHHIWLLWAKETLMQHTNTIDKDLIRHNDEGWSRIEIGDYMMFMYGDAFWKKKKTSTTTPEQVVNSYLSQKIPTKVAKADLLNMCLFHLKQLEK